MSTATVNTSFPKTLLKTMDHVAKQESRSRSELLREAARIYVERKQRWGRLFAYWHATAERTKTTPQELETAIADVRARRRTS